MRRIWGPGETRASRQSQRAADLRRRQWPLISRRQRAADLASRVGEPGPLAVTATPAWEIRCCAVLARLRVHRPRTLARRAGSVAVPEPRAARACQAGRRPRRTRPLTAACPLAPTSCAESWRRGRCFGVEPVSRALYQVCRRAWYLGRFARSHVSPLPSLPVVVLTQAE